LQIASAAKEFGPVQPVNERRRSRKKKPERGTEEEEAPDRNQTH
jgi:hypothetical protein